MCRGAGSERVLKRGSDAVAACIPKGPCTQIVDTLAPKYPNTDYFKAKVSTIWVHGPLGYVRRSLPLSMVVCHLFGLPKPQTLNLKH